MESETLAEVATDVGVIVTEPVIELVTLEADVAITLAEEVTFALEVAITLPDEPVTEELSEADVGAELAEDVLFCEAELVSVSGDAATLAIPARAITPENRAEKRIK